MMTSPRGRAPHAVLAVLAAAALLAACGETVASGAQQGGRSSSVPSSPPASPASPASEPAAPTSPTSEPAPPTAVATPIELPRGGREVFPRYRLVGYSGGAGTEAFGRLGVGDLDERVQEILGLAPPFAGGREVMPVLELVAVVVDPVPGADGQFRRRVGDEVIQRYLDAARRYDAMLLLNIQPGRADFLDEVKALEKWLVNPDVGVALDPEWAVGDDQIPGQVYGSTTGAELDGVAAWLDELVTAYALPQKVMVFHQVAARVVVEQEQLLPRPGVAVIKSVDGIGSVEDKRKTWDVLVRDLPAYVSPGIKLFYEEDARHGPLMTPEQVLALPPQPEYVLYE